MLSGNGTMHGGCTAMLVDEYAFFYLCSIVAKQWVDTQVFFGVHLCPWARDKRLWHTRRIIVFRYYLPFTGIVVRSEKHKKLCCAEDHFRGDKLRIVSTTLTLGSRALSARCEVRFLLALWLHQLIYLASKIWNVTRHRLMASAVHIKMDSSESKLSVKLWAT